MTSPELLSAYEVCPRKAFWRSWQRNKLSTTETLREALYRVLTAPNAEDGVTWGQTAGEAVLDLAASPGLDVEGQYVYACAMNHANLADLLATTLRKPGDKAWLVPEAVQNWTSAVLVSPEGDKLRRLVIVSHWTDERHYSECRNWHTLGEMAAYKLPMDLCVLIIGNQRNGRRHSHWTKALRHPANKSQLRFRRRVGNTSGGFKDSWTEIWREDHEEISRETWLNGMLQDDVMRDCAFTVHMPALPPEQCRYFMDLAERKLEIIQKMKEKPPLQLTGCDWPVKCPFLGVCHAIPEKEPSEKLGFVKISVRKQAPQASIRTAG
jgi:hypothetical protein